MPFLVAGHGKLTAYFTMQSDFLHRYGAAPQEAVAHISIHGNQARIFITGNFLLVQKQAGILG